jgi:hypothetical protein
MEPNRDPAAVTDLAQAILKAVRGLRYGSLEIVVHDSKIVRIEKRERIRLDLEQPTATPEANPYIEGLTVTGKPEAGKQ